MNAFPAYFPLAGKRVLIVGEGDGAEAKARLFASSPATVERLSSAAGADARAYVGAVLAFVATADDAAAEAASRAARAAGVPVNVVDRPGLSDFVTPAVIDRGEVVAAIGTGGTAPILASLLRGDIEARVPEGAGRVAALLGRMQPAVRAAFPDLAQRRAFLRSVLDGPAAEAALAGDVDRAEALLREAIAKGLASAGSVRLIDGAGPADLLTLRAARALAEADLLVIDPQADPGIVTLARRDARRVAAQDVEETALQAIIAEGQRVVWITARGGAEAVQLRLGAEEIATTAL
ncbi:MAG TPA: bifunctional precorrin-2 dehydrogenase/sirohydrochlorin ferrochelatase [Caulobacteraceae bacterium]|jgi:precorrin-2 dehydrogenase/sirohydrochlorin ferrochelatase